MSNDYGIYNHDYRHLRSIRNGAISASPEKLGLKSMGNACSDPPTINRDSEGESPYADLETVLPWEKV